MCVRERRRHMEGGSLCNLQLGRTTGSQGFIILQATVPTQSTACSWNGFYNSPKSNSSALLWKRLGNLTPLEYEFCSISHESRRFK